MAEYNFLKIFLMFHVNSTYFIEFMRLCPTNLIFKIKFVLKCEELSPNDFNKF